MHYKKVHSDFTDTTVITTLSVVIKEDYYYCYGSVCKDYKQTNKVNRLQGPNQGCQESGKQQQGIK